jgi:hypothetical protein
VEAFSCRVQCSRKTLSFGAYPEVPLKLARIRRDETRQLIASGTDPSELRKAEKETITAARQQDDEADPGLEGRAEPVYPPV